MTSLKAGGEMAVNALTLASSCFAMSHCVDNHVVFDQARVAVEENSGKRSHWPHIAFTKGGYVFVRRIATKSSLPTSNPVVT
ncbi:MAG: hypothetical protein J2P54_17535 [Bradyrhizobiaceae bacterium]|nr:hypothetical protein [Bradyrhizobiaceae bacterium]